MRVVLLYGPTAFGGLLVLAILALTRVRSLQHRNRERGLEDAVIQRSRELESEHARQAIRNTILETLVTHQPLGVVLDGIAQSIRGETPGSCCAIVLHQASRSHVAAGADVPADWVAALGAPHAIPFETRSEACLFECPAADPAWRAFISGIRSQPPARIYSCPISADLRLGSIIVFTPPGSGETPTVSEQAVQLAQIAIEHSRLYEDLQFQAHHDGLTGLPNRVLFEERLTRAVLEARTLQQRLAVLYVDLDRFKQINDSMSHRIGDLLLREIATRMKKVLRPGDTIARIGGDEFNILLTNIQSDADAESLADRILNSIRQPMTAEGRVLSISASMGIAYFPEDGQSADDLQRDADAAMYCAKGSGRDRAQVFGARNDSLDRIRLEHELRSALRENRFEVHYQPKVMSDGGFVGMEALLRLTLANHGAIPPARFIPLAEESGLIVPLGLWVLGEVCRQIAEWKAQGYGEISVAVNVSPAQISCADFAERVEDALSRYSVSPRLLELELTETLLIGSGDEAHRQMRRLRAIGVTFSIDDFGTGYSSLSYLHRLKVDSIKLDRTFVQSIDTDDAARRLVQAMIGVAEGLGLQVIAEGVETEAQRQALVSAGCSLMQGFLFAMPQAASDLRTYLAGRLASETWQHETVTLGASGPEGLSRIDGAMRRREPAEGTLQPV